jgi:hypothetical protein
MMQMKDGRAINKEQMWDANWMPGMDSFATTYSADLVLMVKSCLNPIARLRPSPDDLLRVCADKADLHVDGMDGNAASRKKQHHLAFTGQSDKYRVGMTLDLTPK